MPGVWRSKRDGRTLTELESELAMARFGVMKHLRVLERAGVIVTRRSGRKKLHFLNPVPIRMIHELEGAPIMAAMLASKVSEQGTGGWAWVLSDMKSVLETGSSM